MLPAVLVVGMKKFQRARRIIIIRYCHCYCQLVQDVAKLRNYLLFFFFLSFFVSLFLSDDLSFSYQFIVVVIVIVVKDETTKRERFVGVNFKISKLSQVVSSIITKRGNFYEILPKNLLSKGARALRKRGYIYRFRVYPVTDVQNA